MASIEKFYLACGALFICLLAWICLVELPKNEVEAGYIPSSPTLAGTTGLIGGSALLLGQSSSGTASITGASPGMPCEASASDGTDFAALGAEISCAVTSSNTATVRVTALVSLTPTAKTYNVRVFP